jgi:hypothetical protein
LARFYRGDHILFLDDLRKSDLVALLHDPPTFEGYYLPSASTYSREKLTQIALEAFRDDELPSAFAEWREVEDTGDVDAESDEPEPEGSDDEHEDVDDGDEIDHTGAEYKRQFQSDLAYSREYADRPLWAYQERAVEVLLESLDPLQPKILHLATGGGKTRVANTIVDRWRISHRGAALWVTKDWRLLKQAAMDFGKRYQRATLVRLGATDVSCILYLIAPPVPWSTRPCIRYWGGWRTDPSPACGPRLSSGTSATGGSTPGWERF